MHINLHLPRLLSLFLGALLVLAPAGPADAVPRKTFPFGSIEGIVISISDGDSITFSNNGFEFNVQLFGIEAPVIGKAKKNEPWMNRPGQRFAGRAFMALAKKILHRQVRLDIIQFDHYGEMVAIVNVDERNINLEMVSEGYAWASPAFRFPDSPYMQAEEQARARRVGLWIQENPQPPWEFRKSRRGTSRDSW